MKAKPEILLVEDDTSIATGLQKVMRAHGYEVTALSRGDAGLEQAIAGSFDVVITDLKLPGLDGLELVRQLHQAKPKLPIILITAHAPRRLPLKRPSGARSTMCPSPLRWRNCSS